MTAMSKCPDYVWRGIEPQEILSTRQAVNIYVNIYIKSYKIKEILRKVFIAD